MGIGLHDPNTDTYLLTAQRAENNQSFAPVAFTAAQLAPFVGMELHLDFYDSFAGPWGWIGIDTVRIPAGSMIFEDGFESGTTDSWEYATA